MTCPVDMLPGFDLEHWDVFELCSLMRCPECTAEDGEGVFYGPGGPPERDPGDGEGGCDCDDIPF